MWNERYSAPGYAYGTEPNEFLASVAEQLPEGPVLCLAEGEGRNGVFLASKGHAVTGVDSSPVGLAKARALAESRGLTVDTVVADLGDYVIEPGAWSGVVSIFCHLPPALRSRVLRASVAGLRPGGVLVVESYTPRQLEFLTGGPRDVSLLVSLEQLRPDLEGLDLVIAREVERDIREGHLHQGRSAVVQVFGVKRG